MKYLVVFVLLAVLLPVALSCKGRPVMSPGKPAPTGKLVSFYYAEHGTMSEPNFEYVLKSEPNGGAQLYVFRPYEENWGDTIVVAPGVPAFVEKMIKENNLQNYEAHYSPYMQVMDGYGWVFEAEFDDAVTLRSSGSNARPGDGTLEGIAAYLDSCYKAIKGFE